MRRNVAGIVLAFIAGSALMAAQHVTYGPEIWKSLGNGSDTRLQVLSQSASGVELELDLSGFYAQEVVWDRTTYQKVFVPGEGHIADVGKPELPAISRYLAVPRNAKIEVEIIEENYEVFHGYDILPVQEPLPDIPNAPTPPFAKDSEIYSADKEYPGYLAEASKPFTLRGVEVTRFTLYPMSYNPLRKELKVYKKLRVRVKFIGGTSFSEARLRSPFSVSYTHLTLPTNREV